MANTPLFSTAYLPSVAYMAALAKYDSIVIEQKETFPKQTFRNRCIIATGNGLQTLSVPVVRPNGNHSRTEEMTISYHEPWNIQHWRAIVTAYNAAPYFLYYRDSLEKILLQPHTRLLDLNHNLLQYCLKKLKINCDIHYSDNFITPDSPSSPNNYTHLTSKHYEPAAPLPPYSQVFDSRFDFQPNLSVIDLLFNLGPEAKDYLQQIPPLQQR